MNWIGLDIGGANLKGADGRGWAGSAAFPLWREPAGLAAALRCLLRDAPAAGRLAVTMTGELCDCFRTKAEGVRTIIKAVETAAAGYEVLVYIVDGRFVSAAEGTRSPRLAAASNWHALASFAGRFVEEDEGLLVDIGSTTADVIPLVAGRPRTRGKTDIERLAEGELVYTGVGRTPVCAVVEALPWRGKLCPTAAEFFATTADAYVLLGDRPEDFSANWTADGRPLTAEFAKERIGRMLCSDETEFDANDAKLAAASIRDRQVTMLADAVTRVARRGANLPTRVIVSGSGEFLTRRAIGMALPEAKITSLAEKLGPRVSMCGPAHAVAVLAREEFGDG